MNLSRCPQADAGSRLLLALLLAVAIGSARAAEEEAPILKKKARTAVLAISLDDDSGSEAAALERALGAEASRRGEAVADAISILDKDRVAFRDKQMRNARLALISARGYFDQNEMTAARGEVARAVELFEQADLSQPLDDLFTALTYRAAIRANDLDSAGSTLDLRKVATLGGPTADPEIFSEDVVADSERARVYVGRGARGTLFVRTRPVKGRVYLDGALVGTTPCEIPELATGEHYVAVRAIGYEPTQTKVTVGVSAELELALDPIPTSAAENARWAVKALAYALDGDGERMAEAGGRLALALEADEVLVAAVQRSWSNIEMRGARVRRDETILGKSEYEGPRDGLDETIRELARGLYRPLGSAVPKAPEPPNAFMEFWNRPRNWVLAGAVGLAASWGTTAYLAYSKTRELRRTAQVEPSVPELQADARARAGLADTLLGVTMLAAGAYGVMLYLDERGEKKFAMRFEF